MSGYVCVDANVVVKWLLPEEDSPIALALADKLRADAVTLIAPPHMPIEVLSVIGGRVVRGELTQVEGDDLVDVFADLPIETPAVADILRKAIDLVNRIEAALPAGLYKRALRLAHRYGRPTVYDTHYVALAELAGCDFWTADMRLVNALGNSLPFVRPLHSFAP